MNDDELKRFIESTAEKTRRHFDVVAERLDSKLDLLAEGVTGAVDRLDSKIDRLAAEMANEFNDVRSMIKFPHHADLQARVERLESSTH
ncbi:MAG TPA: hypothetical protein VF432_17695 [Thermoanaerobaculia bacterium]